MDADLSSDKPAGEEFGRRGSNQSGMRDHNERLVLTILRAQGGVSKTDIARITGLSAQTVSVIMRALESDGLLQRGDPIRGRIGQPSVPMFLHADGAFFFGLKIGRRSVDLTLVDFVGQVRASRRQTYAYPTPSGVIDFVASALPQMAAMLPAAMRARVSGLGVAMPFQLWSWVQDVGAPQAEMDQWRQRDIQSELAAATGLPVFVQNDATSACGAELVFGTGDRPRDFLYFYIGYFVGGGLVLNGQLFLGRSGNAAGVGPLPVARAGGQVDRLLGMASMSHLASAMAKDGSDATHLWEQHETWTVAPKTLSDWMDQAALGLAWAALSAASLLEIETVMIDGWMPTGVRAELTRRTQVAFQSLDLSGIAPPAIRQGTVGAEARALGAAAIPLSQRYLIDQNAAARAI